MGDYWKKECFKERKKSSYAWGQYFQLQEKWFEAHSEIYYGVQKPEMDITESNIHLQNFINDLYKKSKETIECPICLDTIDYKELDTTSCGHNFHKTCLKTIKDTASEADEKHIDCPICRKKIYIKKK